MIVANRELLERQLAETRRTADRQRILKQLHRLRESEEETPAAK
ncbi:hypothetical protein [Lignipirellula cremea]|uniref:Uncharacterized protein n=1 Tax=Lignipirellula cremea TaxID=2528010 RepID=A0A518DNG6_9BACT|nr:hypothetical protein [Lignipirellula cremea]QDU93376.1 hypothetical protein Pla8534_11560 [Lignipirellula cremea]